MLLSSVYRVGIVFVCSLILFALLLLLSLLFFVSILCVLLWPCCSDYEEEDDNDDAGDAVVYFAAISAVDVKIMQLFICLMLMTTIHFVLLFCSWFALSLVIWGFIFGCCGCCFGSASCGCCCCAVFVSVCCFLFLVLGFLWLLRLLWLFWLLRFSASESLLGACCQLCCC